MLDERVSAQNITLYPSQIAKVERMMNALKIRKFSQAIQRIIDELPEPVLGSAEKPDTAGGEIASGNIGA